MTVERDKTPRHIEARSVGAIGRIEQHHKRKADGLKMTTFVFADLGPPYFRSKRRKMNQENYKP
jgi:hypothetical protein